jgi:16S rRNA processing protein RimM
MRAGNRQENIAGSLMPGEPAFLAVGNLRRPHGVHGEMLMEVLTDFPERLKARVTVYVGPECQPFQLRSVRQHRRDLLVAFEGINTPEEAGELRNRFVQVRADDRPPLPPGEYYQHQILGLRVTDENGVYLGQITEILETGANNVYVVRPPTGSEILLPATDEVILGVDLDNGEIRVHLLPGLS